MKRRHLSALTDPANDPVFHVVAPVDRQVAMGTLLEIFKQYEINAPTAVQLRIYGALTDALCEAYRLGHQDGEWDARSSNADTVVMRGWETAENGSDPIAPVPNQNPSPRKGSCWHIDCASHFCDGSYHRDASGFKWIQRQGDIQ